MCLNDVSGYWGNLSGCLDDLSECLDGLSECLDDFSGCLDDLSGLYRYLNVESLNAGFRAALETMQSVSEHTTFHG